jgi:maltose alpha-D-glucosyltransferase/alpha-amylase
VPTDVSDQTRMKVKKPCSATDPLWYKDAVIYELHVRAFADSNDDGIGDFQGLISKLDYLQSLGVTCLWILPFFPSPGRDDGYDISDYNSVNPQYGTVEDFQQFLDAAHLRNMQVLIELVINHTSDQHPWFQKARRAPKGSPERNMYVWSDSDKLYEGVRIIFTDTEKSNWTWDEVAQQYYWHRFFSHQPDLNFDNPQVMEEVLNAMRFWMDMGVDGLRLDAIPYLVERDGTSCENVPETHVLIKKIRAVIDEEYENRLVLAEANMWPDDVRPYFGDGDECHMAFHFPLMPRIYMALRQEDRLPITDIMARTPEIPANCQWGLFLRNHDELTLEMVTDDERDYMNLAYAADTRMRINVGIRRRLAPLVDNNRRRIELLNSLLLSFPGTPIMYYGDEIGMGDNIYLGDRNGVRTPMQWNSDRNAGFSKAVPAKLYFPVIMDPIWGYQAINVEAQESDPSSLLQWTRNMIALRKLFQVFGRGTLEFLLPENRKVLAYIRDAKYDDGHIETVLCVANLSRFAQPVALDLAKFAGRQPMEMLGYVPFPLITETAYPLTLAPYSFLWLELQQASQTPVADTMTNLVVDSEANRGMRASEVTKPAEKNLLLSEAILQALETALPEYLVKQRWFGGKSRTIESVRIASKATITGADALLTVLDVQYQDGAADRYQLPVAAVSGTEIKTLGSDVSAQVILRLEDNGVETILYDACLNPRFRSALLHLATGNTHSDTLLATASQAAPPDSLLTAESRVGSAEQSNTSILFGDQAILKLYRRLQVGENPDVEIARFLTNVAHYSNTPAHLGDLAWKNDGSTVAFLQKFASNTGDGWSWITEDLARIYERAASLSASPEEHVHFADLAGANIESVKLIGRRTAEMHLALATPTEDAAFAAEPYTAENLEEIRNRIEHQIETAFRMLESKVSTLSAEDAEQAATLLRQRDKLTASVQSLTGDLRQFGQRIRIHGDYHLGQLLHTADDFLIVDFEGEPGRPLAERRTKQSPLKDVAGMLRSFSYAANSSLATYLQTVPTDQTLASAWSSAWERAVNEAFLSSYRETVSTRPGLLPEVELSATVLRAFLIEKTIYELVYEMNNRPQWLYLPLQGLLDILQNAN